MAGSVPIPAERSTFRSHSAAETAGVGCMRADRVSGDLTLHLTGDPLEYALFGQVHHGTWNLGPRRHQHLFGPGDSLLYPIGAAFTLDAQHFDVAVASVPLDRLAALAASHTGIAPQVLRFHAMTAVSPAMARHFTATLSLVHRDFHDASGVAASPLITEQLTQMMMAAVLATFPNTAMTDAPTSGPGYLAPAALRRAVDYIDAHADQPLTLADIAAATGPSGRALQHAFRRHYATTPMAYLRQVRLHRAHLDLLAADPTRGDTIAAIAARWGYRTPNRFRTAYHAVYGVLPSHTLRT